jgi:hypothetical protein
MTENSKTTGSDMVVQEHCIDLPGESVQCWIGGGTDKLKVILRKHRDVIFDLHFRNGKTYTLEATESDFYNVRDKKLVAAAQHGKVTFKDGERMHVWVSRGFRGALVLRSEEQEIYKVEPNKWDRHRYGDGPNEKPAPIIVAIGGDTAPPMPQSKTTSNSEPIKRAVPVPVIASSTGSAPDQGFLCPVVCVIDGKVAGMPADIAEHFKNGGDHSGFSDIDPNHVGTRNWIWGQVAGTGAYVKDNWEWLRASLDGKTSRGFQLVKAQVRYVRGRVRFYFSGYSNSNAIFGRGGFGPSHDRIMTIFSGVGKTSSTFAAALKGVAATFKGNAMVSFVFGSATAFAEWTGDVHKDGYDLAGALITSTVKAILAAAAVTLVVVSILAFLMFALGISLSVIAVGAITIVAGFLANYAIETADKAIGRAVTHDDSNADGTSSIVAGWIRNAGAEIHAKIHQNWSYLMHKMSVDYQEIKF